MAVIDATVLLYFFEPDALAPIDPATGAPVTNTKVRVDHLVETAQGHREPLVIPTPALSEVLVHAGGAMADYLDALTGKVCFRVAPFDERAAVELAAMTKDALSAGDLRAGTDLT